MPTSQTNFDGLGHSLPGELLPRRLIMGRTEFTLGPAAPAEPNVLRCDGQVIELPPGYDRLWLLAASSAAPLEACFGVDDAEHRVHVASWTGWLSERQRRRRWGGLVAARPGFLTRDDLAWVGTHRHVQKSAGARVEDEHYVFCYLFRYAIDLAPGSSKLQLPTNGHLHLFAATLSSGLRGRSRPASALYG